MSKKLFALLLLAAGSSMSAHSLRNAGAWLGKSVQSARAYGRDFLVAALPAWHVDSNSSDLNDQLNKFSSDKLHWLQYKKRTSRWIGYSHNIVLAAVVLMAAKKALRAVTTRRTKAKKKAKKLA